MVLLEEKKKTSSEDTYELLASALEKHGYHTVASNDRLTVEGFRFTITNSVNQIDILEDRILLPAAASQDTLKGMIMGVLSPKFSSKPAIVNFVRKIGIRTNLKGYRFLITAISLAVQDPSLLHKVTYTLYPAVAKIHGVNQHCVERDIRSAIDSAYQNDPEQICLIFQDRFTKPYSSEIIKLAANAILNNGQK